MRNILLIILVAVADCEVGRKFRGKNISEEISDDFETCSKGMTSWMDFPAGFVQNAMDKMFSSKKSVEPTFLWFSCKNDREPTYVTNANFTPWVMDEYDFDPSIKTVFIIYGFKDSNAPWTRKLKDALILREDCNRCIVEYGHPSETYSDVSKKIPQVGKQVVLFIRNLMKSKRLDPQHVHIIGHSAGAQIAGFAGQEFKKMENRPIGRITGLDPAGPNFYAVTPDQRLDASDAGFVDIIHSNGGCNRLEGFGYSNPIGHFDFYPNGGQIQPGCMVTSQFLSKMNFSLAKNTFKYLFGTLEQSELQVMKRMLCSHTRSYEFFTASILNDDCKFYSTQCSSWKSYVSGQCDGNKKVVMGYYADGYKDIVEDGTHKKFYLETTTDPPFCR